MSIVLTAATDPTCRAIATFLHAQLSGLESDEIEVATVLDFDGMIGGAGIELPLLQVYRTGSRGDYLETSVVNIDYYLYSVAAMAERPGILRLVETAIAHSITDRLPYSGLSDWVRLEIVSSDRSFLKLESGEIFPLLRVTAELQEINVISPGTYVEIDLGGEPGGGGDPGGGTDPPPTPTTVSYERTFEQAALSIAGVLIVTHNLNSYPSGLMIWNGAGEQVIPDRVEVASLSTVAIDLGSFAPLSGLWRVSIIQ